mgnify:CR=1 FL=1
MTTTPTKADLDFDDLAKSRIIKVSGHLYEAFWPTSKQIVEISRAKADLDELLKKPDSTEDDAKALLAKFTEAVGSFILPLEDAPQLTTVMEEVPRNVSKRLADFLADLAKGE